MPYTPESHPRKLKLSEAAERICTVDKCSVEAARVQLRQMFRDGKLYLYWDSIPRVLVGRRLGRPVFADIPPSGEHPHWDHVQIRWDEQSEIYDDFAEVDHAFKHRGDWRTLWVDEASLEAQLAKFAAPETSREAPKPRQGKIGKLLDRTYPPDGQPPPDASPTKILSDIERHTGQTISSSGWHDYRNRQKRRKSE